MYELFRNKKPFSISQRKSGQFRLWYNCFSKQWQLFHTIQLSNGLSRSEFINYPEHCIATIDGFNFPFIHSFLKNISTNNDEFIYVPKKNWSKTHFCGVKQVYPNGNTWFVSTESIRPKNSGESKINTPRAQRKNIVGIKFVNIFSGKFLFQISNTQGQTVFGKELDVSVTTLQRGMYWLRLIEVTSHLSCVNQL